jgi:N-acetyl-anhydromuramyl-L-alanine amidase AmpD
VRDVVKYLKRRHKSYHYIIARDGTIYKLVDPKYEATHAGISRWDGHITLNDKSIGIALNNNSRDPYTDEQYISLIWLIKQLQDRYPDITTDRIVGHSDVAWPRGRKQDPGNHFEWERLRSILAPQQVTYDSTNDSLAGNDSQDSLLQPIQHVGELPEAVEAEIR